MKEQLPMKKTEDTLSKFREELETLVNRYSVENLSNTPDFILATYITGCLYVFESATLARDKWYGFYPSFQSKISNMMEEMARQPKEKMGERQPGEKCMYEIQRKKKERK